MQEIQPYSTMTPKVSIIVPNYNHARFLKQRIDSILSQTYKDFELILLDDCSTDNSSDVLMSYKDNPHVAAIIINQKNTGSPFRQWVKGIREAKGKYIWIAESDDYAGPDFLKETTALLDNYPDANICLTGSRVVNENDEYVDEQYPFVDRWTEDGKEHIFDSNYFITNHMAIDNSVYNGSMVLFRREGCLDNIDPEFVNMRYAGDWLFWIEQIKKGRQVISLHKKLNFWRKHTCNTTAEGFRNFNSLQECAYVKDYLFRTTLKRNTRDILIVKSSLYKSLDTHPFLTPARRKELFRMLRKKYHVTYLHYLLGKICARRKV